MLPVVPPRVREEEDVVDIMEEVLEKREGVVVDREEATLLLPAMAVVDVGDNDIE